MTKRAPTAQSSEQTSGHIVAAETEQRRQAETALLIQPFGRDAHVDAMMDRAIVLAPLIVHWRYRVGNLRRFQDWLTTRDIVLSSQRLMEDDLLSGVRYGGTYVMAQGATVDGPADLVTVWGYLDEDAMTSMDKLCSGQVERRSIIQNDLLDFVRQLRAFIDGSGSQSFRQDVLVSAAVRTDVGSSVSAQGMVMG